MDNFIYRTLPTDWARFPAVASEKRSWEVKNICIFLQMPGCEDFQIHCMCQRALPTSVRMPALETFPNLHNLHNAFTSHPLSLYKAFELPSLTPSMHVSFPVEVAPKHLTSEKRKHNAAQSWRSLTVGDNKPSSPSNCRENFQVSHVVSPWQLKEKDWEITWLQSSLLTLGFLHHK